jgi:DNA-binding transcriptional regulator LsrR (DeoR family)
MRNWEDVLPKHVAKYQHSWERRMRVFRAINAGAARKEIAKAMGLSLTRVRQIISRADREVRYGYKSPVEKYLNEFPWFNVTLDERFILERARKFDKRTKSGRNNIRRTANNFIMGHKP